MEKSEVVGLERVSGLERGHRIFSENEWSHIASSLRLSPREFQIVRHVFDGAKELTIAEDLKLSGHTVHTYFRRLYRKLGVGNRCELIVRVVADAAARRRLADVGSTRSVTAQGPSNLRVG